MTQEEAKYILEHTVLSWSVSGSDAREAIQMAIKELKRKKGKWVAVFIEYTDGTNGARAECPFCKVQQLTWTNFCPNCGADMRGEANE